jgi:hypothetical protein
MRRRDFMKVGGATALLAGTNVRAATEVHNFDRHDFGAGPAVRDRLYQGPFPTDRFAGWQVVMATTASNDIIPGFGMGLITYLCDEVGPPSMHGESVGKSLEDLAKFSLGTKLYLRVDWKDVQSRPGRLDLCEHWKIAFDLAKRYDKRLGLRVMMSNPDVEGLAMPDYLAKKVPMVELGEWQDRKRFEPRYDNAAFQDAFNELTGLLADAYDGHPQVEYVDTAMYGFWGEGHTWPLERNPFPDYATAEATWVRMFEKQLALWKKTPLTTNTQPDFSKVGNFELLERTVRSHNWLRTDTIFIENEQIEALSNRPAWTGVTVEVPNGEGTSGSLHLDDGVPLTDNVIGHVRDVGAGYFSLWNWHRIRADRLHAYYDKYPDAINALARSIGYRVRPSWVWTYDAGDDFGLILGMVNDGISGVPGVLRISVLDAAGRELSVGGLDAGYPLPGKVRQAKLPLPRGTDWKGLRIKGEIEVKGQRYPVRWACKQSLNADGTLTLRPTPGID